MAGHGVVGVVVRTPGKRATEILAALAAARGSSGFNHTEGVIFLSYAGVGYQEARAAAIATLDGIARDWRDYLAVPQAQA